MSKVVQIRSESQFQSLLSSSRLVVVDYFADWCGPCKAIAPVYEQLAGQLTRPNIITFTKVNTDEQAGIAQRYGITTIPTFMVFKGGKEVERIKGAKPADLSAAIKKLAAEAESDSSSSNGFGDPSAGSIWRGADLPRNYTDVTDQIDLKGLDLLNADGDFGNGKTLFDKSRPSAVNASASSGKGKGKGKAGEDDGKNDWVESDTDEQLMLYIPFQSTLKVHTIHMTSFAPKSSDDNDDDEAPMRPQTVHLYTNRAHNLGFEEAEDIPPTQAIEIKPEDWDEKTSTARLELRFVKFQNVTSIVLFVVKGDGDGDKVRVDRLRIIGESGEKRDMGKLEKIGDEQGE